MTPLTLAEVAVLKGCKVHTVRRACRMGVLPFRQVGRSYLVDRAAAEAWAGPRASGWNLHPQRPGGAPAQEKPSYVPAVLVLKDGTRWNADVLSLGGADPDELVDFGAYKASRDGHRDGKWIYREV